VAEYLQGATRPGTFASIRSLGESMRDRPGLVQDALARVKAPTLVVWGRDDGWIPLAHADRFCAAVPGARKVVIDECGHVPQEEMPERVLELLRGFLAQVQEPTTPVG
jgi:pimeloyl-ACP methyl ester carboxylesterase